MFSSTEAFKILKKMASALQRVPTDPKVILGAIVVTILLTLLVGYFLFRCSKFSRARFENATEQEDVIL